MADVDTAARTAPKARQHPLERMLFYVGSAALLMLVAIETAAVLGRHLSLPLIGAIELIQACILVAASSATVFATLRSGHAVVKLLSNRLSTTAVARLARLNSMLSALFFAGLALGSLWLARDFWSAYEESELLHIQYRPLRMLATLSAVIAMLIFLYRALQRRDAKQ